MKNKIKKEIYKNTYLNSSLLLKTTPWGLKLVARKEAETIVTNLDSVIGMQLALEMVTNHHRINGFINSTHPLWMVKDHKIWWEIIDPWMKRLYKEGENCPPLVLD